MGFFEVPNNGPRTPEPSGLLPVLAGLLCTGAEVRCVHVLAGIEEALDDDTRGGHYVDCQGGEHYSDVNDFT